MCCWALRAPARSHCCRGLIEPRAGSCLQQRSSVGCLPALHGLNLVTWRGGGEEEKRRGCIFVCCWKIEANLACSCSSASPVQGRSCP